MPDTQRGKHMRFYEPIHHQKFTKTLPTGVPSGNVYIGECIYCRAKQNLSDEHTIPYGLWGKNFLKKASCSECSRATSRIEYHVLKGTLDNVREFLNAPTRHSKKRGHWSGRTIIQNEEGEEINVPISILPKFLLLPLFDYLPRKFSSEPKKSKHYENNNTICVIQDKQDPVASGYWDKKGSKINSKPWARFIAKITYGEYIRQHEPDFRSRKLSDFIVRGYGDQSNFVGGRSSPPSVNSLYKTVFCAIAREKGFHTLVGYLRLFALFETPSYLVYLGEVPPSRKLPSNLCTKYEWTPDNIWPNYHQDEIIESGPLTGTPVD